MTSFEWRDAPEAEFAVLGDPVAHSRSPQMHEAAYRALRLPYSYVRVRVPAAEFAEAAAHLADLGYTGANVTVPLKEEAWAWASQPNEERSVNTVRFSDRSGISTDGDGFLDDVIPRLGPCPFPRMLLIGAGGAARAVFFASLRQGFSGAVWNRTAARATELVAGQTAWSVAETLDPAGFDVIVNATSLGHSGASVEMDFSRADPHALAYDLSYGVAAEPFLIPARQAGLEAVDGLGMLVHQAARSFTWWTGTEAPIELMKEAVGWT